MVGRISLTTGEMSGAVTDQKEIKMYFQSSKLGFISVNSYRSEKGNQIEIFHSDSKENSFALGNSALV